MIDAIDEINKAEYLFLASIEEFAQNNLRIVVQEGRATGVPKNIEVAGTVIRDVRSVSPYVHSAWEILIERYVAYSVRNESYVKADPEESWSGHLFRTYSKSKFLDYVRGSTFACEEYPGPLRHYELVCSDHIIYVVVARHPAIQRIGSQPGAGAGADPP